MNDECDRCGEHTLECECEGKLSYSQEFIDAIHLMIHFWDKTDGSSREKMEGLSHSILCMLDGNAGYFSGDIESLCKEGNDFMLHEMFCKNHK